MAKSNISQALEEMSQEDIYSLLLFALFKLKDIPEYLTLSELSYILDNKNFINFIEYYGGMTIKVPTRDEFKLIIDALLIYQFVNIENNPIDNAYKMLEFSKERFSEVYPTYIKLIDILAEYNFNRK